MEHSRVAPSKLFMNTMSCPLQVYCCSHVPKSGPGHFDQTSVGIRQALNVPRTNKFINEQIRGQRTDLEGKSILF